MLSVEEALGRILGFVDVLEPEERPVLDALGQVLAGDVVSPFDIPPLENSAMDGYAVQAASVEGASGRLTGAAPCGGSRGRRASYRPRT